LANFGKLVELLSSTHFVTAAKPRRREILGNLAEVPSMENTGTTGSSAIGSAFTLDRRVSVAPMMDYADEGAFG
jgi:hypothetical protein